jgi:pimeloyl-ACP methyl ester carboxylesterase
VDNKIRYGQAGIESLHLKVNGQRIHYLKAGSGAPVVLVHGGASDSRDWVDTMAALSHRFSLYAPDLIGFGQNDRDENGYYLSDFSDFLLGFIDTLQIQNPVLVGHSFGGRVCLDVALKRQEQVCKLILVDASGLDKISRIGSGLMTFFWALRKVLRRPQPYPRFLAKEGEDYSRVGDDELRRLGTPTLLIWKRLDPYMPVSIARRAEKLIPKARLAVLKGYGHAPHQQNSDAFNRILLDFLDHD